MPRIFDNIEDKLLPVLQETLSLCERADFCVGYFNLRGWKELDSYLDRWAGGLGHCCRLLVGMQRMPQEEIHALLGLLKNGEQIDQAMALRLKKEIVDKFREQLTVGAPTNEDETLNKREVENVRFDLTKARGDIVEHLCKLSHCLMREIRENSKFLKMKYRDLGTLTIQCTYPKLSKHLIDEIDHALAEHYDFTDEELDSIINYDIKYRMGQGTGESKAE